MKYGMNLYGWTTNLTSDFFHLFPTLKSLGYDGVEVPVTPGNANNYLEITKAPGGRGPRLHDRYVIAVHLAWAYVEQQFVRTRSAQVRVTAM